MLLLLLLLMLLFTLLTKMDTRFEVDIINANRLKAWNEPPPEELSYYIRKIDHIQYNVSLRKAKVAMQ